MYKYFPFILYFPVLLLLLFGLLFYEGYDKGLKIFSAYVLSFVIFASALVLFFREKKIIILDQFINWWARRKFSLNDHALLLNVGFVAYMILYFCYLGHVPLFSAFVNKVYYEVVKVRQAIPEESGAFFNYVNSFLLRAILPMGLVVFYINKNRYFSLFFALSSFFALSLIQKSYIVLLVIPLVIMMVYRKKWRQVAATGFYVLLCLYCLVLVTNPQLKGEVVERPDLLTTLGAIGERVFLVPGRVVSQWAELIPETVPFTYGCSYRIVAKIMDCEFHNTSVEIFRILNPDLVALGIEGSINAASFMQDYANFGYYGLVYSALILCLIFLIVTELFRNNFIIGLCLNAVPILLLSSLSLNSIIASGGWLLTLLLYAIFSKDFVLKKE